MSQEIKQIRIQSRVDTKENWIKENPTLLNREIGYERETGQYKIGDGETSWNNLSYSSGFDDTYIIEHIQNNIVHITNDDRNNWNNKSDKDHEHTTSNIIDFPTSMPASDVYSWAKESSKPTYTASEVGAVPTTRTINNKALNGNITLSASDIGAAQSSHDHDGRYYTEDEVNQKINAHTGNTNNPHGVSVSQIGNGTFSGQIEANISAMSSISTAQVRNIYAGTSDMTPGTSSLASGTIYLVYEP